MGVSKRGLKDTPNNLCQFGAKILRFNQIRIPLDTVFHTYLESVLLLTRDF